jgi:hypothetical protein
MTGLSLSVAFARAAVDADTTTTLRSEKVDTVRKRRS